MNLGVNDFIIPLLVFCIFFTPIFCYIFYQWHRLQQSIFLTKRRPILTYAILISMYILTFANVLLSPDYAIVNHLSYPYNEGVYYLLIVSFAPCVIMCSFARYIYMYTFQSSSTSTIHYIYHSFFFFFFLSVLNIRHCMIMTIT